jgi:hypothetical protein
VSDFPHPNCDDAVNAAVVRSEVMGGADLNQLAVGKRLVVKCQDCTLTVERREDGLYISGHNKFCPMPIKCSIPGSTFSHNGSMLKQHWVGRGMYMEFHTEAHPKRIVTSEIQEVTEL